MNPLKLFSDLVESVLAAIYLDTKGDLGKSTPIYALRTLLLVLSTSFASRAFDGPAQLRYHRMFANMLSHHRCL